MNGKVYQILFPTIEYNIITGLPISLSCDFAVFRMKFGSPIDIDDGSSSVLQYRCLSCEYLNVTNGQWETEGCSARKVNDREVTCHCNHTTNFAAFMSPISIEMNMTDAQYKVLCIFRGIKLVGTVLFLLMVRSKLKQAKKISFYLKL